MRYLFAFLLLISSTCFGSGKFIFKPEYNQTKDIWSQTVGISIHQKIFGPLFYTNWTGVSVDDSEMKMHKEFKDFSFKNGLMIQPIDRLQVEVGHEYQKDLKSDYYQNLAYLRFAAQLW